LILFLALYVVVGLFWTRLIFGALIAFQYVLQLLARLFQ